VTKRPIIAYKIKTKKWFRYESLTEAMDKRGVKIRALCDVDEWFEETFENYNQQEKSKLYKGDKGTYLDAKR